MRIIFLTQWFDPEPMPRGLAFARELVKHGVEVEVVTGFPNYPGGKLYPGYKIKLIQREEIDGVKITRLPIYPSHDTSAFNRICNYGSFAASALIYGLFVMQRPDLIYAYHLPLTVGVTAALIRLFRRIPIVYDIQDMWPDTLTATGMFNNKRMLSIVGYVCAWVYRRVDKIVAQSTGFKRLLIERNVPEQKIDIIHNWCDESQITGINTDLPKDFPDSSYFRVLFAGNMGKAQALSSVIKTAEILKTAHPKVRFVFIGGGVEVDLLKTMAHNCKLENVVFFPQVPMSQVGSFIKAADVLLVHLKNDPLFSITIPSKTQAYMAIGKPILMAVPGDAAELVKTAKCGCVAESENPQSIANAIYTLIDMGESERTMMGERARNYYQQELCLNVGCRKCIAIFNLLVT